MYAPNKPTALTASAHKSAQRTSRPQASTLSPADYERLRAAKRRPARFPTIAPVHSETTPHSVLEKMRGKAILADRQKESDRLQAAMPTRLASHAGRQTVSPEIAPSSPPPEQPRKA